MNNHQPRHQAAKLQQIKRHLAQVQLLCPLLARQHGHRQTIQLIQPKQVLTKIQVIPKLNL